MQEIRLETGGQSQQNQHQAKKGQPMSLRERALQAKQGGAGNSLGGESSVTDSPIRSTQVRKMGDGLGIQESPVLTLEERLVKERREKAIAAAENEYLDEYERINAQYKNDYTAAVLRGEMKPMSMADVQFPDMNQVVQDQEKLYERSVRLKSKREDNARLNQKNESIREQMLQLKETLMQYRAKIRAYDLKLSKGQAYIEVPCQHAELISQLEVSLSSKKNEIIHLRQHLGKL